MKKFLTNLILLISFTAAAQTLEYDFSTGQYTSGFDDGKFSAVQNDGALIIKVKNINTFKYQVAITGKNVNYATEMPDELKVMFRQSTTETNSVAKEAEQVDKATKVMSNLSKKIDDLPASLSMGRNNKLASLNSTMKDLVDACTKYRDAIKEIYRLQLHRSELIGLAQRSRGIPSFDVQSPENLRHIYEVFTESYTEAEAQYVQANALATDEQVSEHFREQGVIQEAYEDVEDSHEKILRTDVIKLIEDVINLQNALGDPRTFEVVSGPIAVDDADYISFHIIITPHLASEFAPREQKQELYGEIPVNGGFKVDFSVGPVFSFGTNSHDAEFYLAETDTEGFSELKRRDNRNDINPGIAAMMHIYPRRVAAYNIGAMFGVGAGFEDVDDADIAFFTGVSLIIGKSQKLMVSSGISFLNVQRLKREEFSEGSIYATEDFDTGAVTESYIKSSFFVSLSYNITNRKER